MKGVCVAFERGTPFGAMAAKRHAALPTQPPAGDDPPFRGRLALVPNPTASIAFTLPPQARKWKAHRVVAAADVARAGRAAGARGVSATPTCRHAGTPSSLRAPRCAGRTKWSNNGAYRIQSGTRCAGPSAPLASGGAGRDRVVVSGPGCSRGHWAHKGRLRGRMRRAAVQGCRQARHGDAGTPPAQDKRACHRLCAQPHTPTCVQTTKPSAACCVTDDSPCSRRQSGRWWTRSGTKQTRPSPACFRHPCCAPS